MQRLSGRLQESNHRGPLPKRDLGTFTLWKMIYCIQFLSYGMCVHVVYSKWQSAHSERRDQRMLQVVAYESLKTMEIH